MKKNTVLKKLNSHSYLRPYRPLPFWSWNDKLDSKRLTQQIEWMHQNGIGGFFMHARGGLITDYLSEEWMQACDACTEKALELDMDAYMYDENGWPSGFVGGKLLSEENNDQSISYKIGAFDENAFVSYEADGDKLVRATEAKEGKTYLNVYRKISVSTVDVLNPEVTENFLDETHRAYKKRYGKQFSKKIKGFFTDEPQYFRWDTSYTSMVARYFKEKYNEDILDGLGLLFVEKEGYEKFRFRYWSAMQELFLKNFSKKIYDFCEENNVKLTGHYVEENSLGYQLVCCGGIMPFYEYEHIPGIDWLGRGIPGELAVKQVGSVAAQMGRNQVLTESFACCGWDVTPRELQRILDFQELGGVNVLCHHLLPSSEYGQRKRDYPQHYTPLNPWMEKGFKAFNDHYTRLGALIGNSTEQVDVCILHPITTCYLDYKRNAERFNVFPVDKALHDQLEQISSMHIPHHFVDETILARHGSVQSGKLVCGKCAYSYLILPNVKNVTRSTLALIKAFVADGGKLLLLNSNPTYLEGEKHDFGTLFTSNCTLEEIQAAQSYSVDNPHVLTCLRSGEDGDFVFAVNVTEEEQTYTLNAAGANSVRKLDLDGVALSCPEPMTRTLRPLQSEVLFLSDEAAEEKKPLPVVTLKAPFDYVASTQNTFMIDKVSYETEDGTKGENVLLTELFNKLLEQRYRGKLSLKYCFETNVCPDDLMLYAEDMNTVSVCVNGSEVKPCGTLGHEPMVNAYKIAPLVHRGGNEIVITVDYFQDEKVYYALFGEGVTESLRNCMVYNTSLESVYLAGSFGVYPVGMKSGQTERTVHCDSFILDERKSKISSLLDDGFCTFAGSLTMKTQIECGKDGCLLQLDGNWQVAEISINGKSKTLIFDTAADVSDLVTEGMNEVIITVTTSLRNLLGPHHYAPIDEPMGLSPYTFTAPNPRLSYSLVKSEF